MAPPTRRRTRATANSSPLVELKSEPKRRVTKAKAKRPARAAEPKRQPEPEPEPEPEQELTNLPQVEAAPAEASPAKAAPIVEEDRTEALELLRLADMKREQNMALSRIDVRPVELSPPTVSPVHAAPPPPSTPRANETSPPPVTPQTSTSFLGSMWSTLKSSVWSTPKPKSARPSSKANTPVAATPSTPIAPPVIGELTMTLTPTPTPIGDNRGNTKVKRLSGRRERAAIIKNVASSVPDAAEEELATKWAEKVLMQLLQESSTSAGDKRKRLEDGMTYGDLNHFNSKPWKPAASSFGLDDDLMDHVDNTPDEPAPMWAILEHLRIEQQWKGKQAEQEYEASPPSAKKRKISTGARELVASPKQPVLPLDHARSPFYNSGGRSTSLRDLRPRSCLDRGATSPDNNIFKQSQQTAAQDESVPFPTSFSVPDDTDSDEDLDEEPLTNGTPGASTTWTQPPPPAPVMPHAELPGSVGPTPPIPSVEGNLVTSPTVARVEAQRAKALKFTPAKPSNLSHMSKPSPSLRSDAGNESILADSPVPMPKTKGSGTATPNIFQSAGMANGASLFQNKTLSNGATPAQDKTSSKSATPAQDTSSSNGTSIFQSKSLSNGTSIFQDKSLSNGTSIFQNKDSSNGASPFKSTDIPNGDSPFQTKSLSNGTFAVKSASTNLALPDYDLTPPDAEPLDLPSDVEADLENFVPSAEFQAQLDAIKNWEDPILVYEDEL
ncbi:uncharacterized protein CC84DRAFT_42264 [Paraphaeosphaeria sporulosa]|uniref:Uncharacterized protein n=1 Tax=Paraphaeosphaeria sporulosa TaxID=1460663 RepID=A0A177CXV8_9PLEO|nr:uncharacterized protein CC84DRAFT_42264 [Paraphaeosphaeria sporulosa]OAG11680.1 hypothetical protein CC84DRAFT_42264 [Paraphaeosphaeria sporulosa]